MLLARSLSQYRQPLEHKHVDTPCYFEHTHSVPPLTGFAHASVRMDGCDKYDISVTTETVTIVCLSCVDKDVTDRSTAWTAIVYCVAHKWDFKFCCRYNSGCVGVEWLFG